MKTGKTLVELAKEIERQQESKRDFVPSTHALSVNVKDVGGKLSTICAFNSKSGSNEFGINELAHSQIAEHVGVPYKYYNKMLAAQPKLLCENVNTWLHSEKAENRMIRTLDGKVRAFLSDRYRPLENMNLAEAVLPTLAKLDLELVSSEITEKRLYLKAVDKSIKVNIPNGAKMGDDSHTIFRTCSPAIVISNSEVGTGALSVETAVWDKVCTNLAVFQQSSLRKYHVGGRHEITESLEVLLSSKTRQLMDAATFAQVAEVVAAAFDRAKFDAQMQKIQGMQHEKIEGDVQLAVELTAEHFGINETEKSSVLRHLIEGGDLTRYGLFNALTRTAEDCASYDRATEFERMGGQFIELPRSDWQTIATAAQ